MYTAIKRSAQSVLHQTLTRDEADRVGSWLADCLIEPDAFSKAAAHYQTRDAFEIGERAARDYIKTRKH